MRLSILLVGVLTSIIAKAFPVSLDAFAGINNGGRGFFGTCADGHSQTSGTASASCGPGAFGSGSQWSGSGQAYATANFGSLAAFATQSISVGNSNILPFESVIEADAAMHDNLALPSNYDSPVFLTIEWTITGSAISGNGRLVLGLDGNSCIQTISVGTATCSRTAELFPGQAPLLLQVSLEILTDLNLSGVAHESATGTADFAHTAYISKLQLFDQNMNLLTGVSLVSDSGFDYQSAANTAVPEPLSLFCVGAGLLALATRFKLNSRNVALQLAARDEEVFLWLGRWIAASCQFWLPRETYAPVIRYQAKN